MLPDCIYREKKGERVDWHWGVLEGEKIVAWLPERYHEWMLHGFEGEGVCWRRESSRLPKKKGGGASQEREAPQGEFATKTSGVVGEESCGCLRNGLLKMGKEGKAVQSNAKAWYGRLSLPDIWHFLKYSVISHQFVLLTFCGMWCASKLLDAAEKWEDQENTRVLERIAQ